MKTNYSFIAHGHKNITGKHKKTLEFTKENVLKIEGDCILGVHSNFESCELKRIIKKVERIKKVEKDKKLRMIIKVNGISDEIVFEPNWDFDDEKELVIRKSNFVSKRTFGINADKSCSDINKELIAKLKDENVRIEIKIESKKPKSI